MEIFGQKFTPDIWPDLRHYSPIRVLDIIPAKSGQRKFTLDFYHAAYPEGVQGKSYKLETIERGEHFILAKTTSKEHDPTRFVLIYNVSYEWLEKHFPGWVKNACRQDGRNSPPDSIFDFLESHA